MYKEFESNGFWFGGSVDRLKQQRGVRCTDDKADRELKK